MSPEDRRAAPPVIVEPEPGSIADTFRELLPSIEFQAIQGARDVLLVVSRDDAPRVLAEAKTNPRLEMDFLRDLCGVDYEGDGLEVVYQLWSYKLRHGVTIKAKVPAADAHIQSAAGLWKAADWHEREARDMFGIVFDGHPNLVPILLPDDMLDHFPLRKDNPLAPLEEWQGTSLGPEMGRAGHIPPGSGIDVKAEGDSSMASDLEPVVERQFDTIDLNINIGPQHPATHGVFRMVLEVDGELVTDVVPHIGYMHRGGEKLSENMDYRQAIGYQDRTEYLSQFNAELCYVLAVEKLAGLEPPERSQYIRVILAELNRISSHFMFLGAFGTDLGILGTSFIYAFREREHILDLFEEISGDRLMYAYFRPGGVAWDVPHNFKERVKWVCDQALIGASDMDRLLTDNEIFISRTLGIGKLTAEECINHGITGPMLRAAGVNYDLRRDEPYTIYDRFDFGIPLGQNGDCYDRYLVRLEEVRQSVKIVLQALEQMPDGPILPERMPRLLRPAAGEVYMHCEDPRGEYGVYLVSKGATQPYRLRMRSPSFCNLSALREMTVGTYVADAVTILGSTDIVLCSVDR